MEKGFTITYEYGDNLYVNPTNRCNFNCSVLPAAQPGFRRQHLHP